MDKDDEFDEEMEMDALAGSMGLAPGDNPNQNYREVEIREQDRYLPIANIARIMKRVLPGNAKIAKDAKESIQACVSEFISFITSEASDKCQLEKRKTINGDDLLWAMSTLGFDQYGDPLRVYLAKYRESVKGDKPEKVKPVKDKNYLKIPKGGTAMLPGGIGINSSGIMSNTDFTNRGSNLATGDSVGSIGTPGMYANSSAYATTSTTIDSQESGTLPPTGSGTVPHGGSFDGTQAVNSGAPTYTYRAVHVYTNEKGELTAVGAVPDVQIYFDPDKKEYYQYILTEHLQFIPPAPPFDKSKPAPPPPNLAQHTKEQEAWRLAAAASGNKDIKGNNAVIADVKTEPAPPLTTAMDTKIAT